MGSKCFDYIIADKIVLRGNKNIFQKSCIFTKLLPSQSNEIKFLIKSLVKDFGLPKDKVIFACFNSSYKIIPPIFESWMNILKCESSILWLLQDRRAGREIYGKKHKKEE